MQALISMKTAGFEVEGLIHVGANDGQERYEYLESGVDPCIYVEPIDSVFANLQMHIAEMPGHLAVQAVCSDLEGEQVEFNIASNSGLSSSILPLGAHAEFHPEITYTSRKQMTTTTVDALIDRLDLPRRPNLLVVDTQGAELKVLKGSRRLLQNLDGVFVEVSENPLYAGGCTHEEITLFLKEFGLRLRWMVLDAHGHGDAFYCRGYAQQQSLPVYEGNLALGKAARQSSVSHWSRPDDAAGALNGRKNGAFGFHTDFEKAAWWEVDLGTIYLLNEIRIYNRIDVARERSRSLTVFISDDADRWIKIHDQNNRLFGGLDGKPLRIFCSGHRARYIQLRLNEPAYFHLDEVEVY